MNWLYTLTPPLGTANKFGISGSIRGRLGKYQLPYGPTWEAAFSWLAGHEDPKVISWMEDSIKGHFRNHRWGIGPGMTEWLEDITAQQIRDYVMLVNADLDLGIKEYGFGHWNALRLAEEFPDDHGNDD